MHTFQNYTMQDKSTDGNLSVIIFDTGSAVLIPPSNTFTMISDIFVIPSNTLSKFTQHLNEYLAIQTYPLSEVTGI